MKKCFKLENSISRWNEWLLYVFFFKQIDKSTKTVELEASTVEIEERGVKLRLTVVDTPGFGDAINNTDRYKCQLYFLPAKINPCNIPYKI